MSPSTQCARLYSGKVPISILIEQKGNLKKPVSQLIISSFPVHRFTLRRFLKSPECSSSPHFLHSCPFPPLRCPWGRLPPLQESISRNVIHQVDHPDVRTSSLDPNRTDSQSPHRVCHERKDMFNPSPNRQLLPIAFFLLLTQRMITIPLLVDAIASLPLLQHGIYPLSLHKK